MKKYKWLWLILPVYLIGATVSPFKVYEILINKDKAYIDHDGLASFERLKVNDVEFDVSGLSTGDVLTFDGTVFGGAPATSGSWLSLSDTPDAYTANKLIGVNSGATALEFKDPFATTEAALELQLTDVTNVYTNNDGLLTADDLSDNTLASLGTSTRSQLNTLIADTVWTTAAPPTVLALSDVPDAYDTGKYLKSTGSGTVWDSPAGAGTVTSVAISGANGISFTGSPITSNGTLAMAIDAPTLATYMGVPDSSTEVASMYDSQVSIVSDGDAIAGTSTVAYRWTPAKVALAAQGIQLTDFSDSTFSMFDDSDITKSIIWDLSSITTGTQWTLTAPNGNFNFNSIGDSFVSNTLTASKVVGSGSASDAVDLDSAETSGYLPNSKLYVMSPSTIKGREAGPGGPPQDLSVAEILAILGTFPDSQVSDTLTASKFAGSGSSSDAIDLDTAEVAGDLPLSKLAQFGAGTFGGRALGGGTGDLQAMTNKEARASLSNMTSLTSTAAAITWSAATGTKFAFNTSVESTTVGPSTTGIDGQYVVFMITKSATAYTVSWNSQFHTLDGTAMPAIPATTGWIGFYYFSYNEFLDDWILQGHTEYQP